MSEFITNDNIYSFEDKLLKFNFPKTNVNSWLSLMLGAAVLPEFQTTNYMY
jgi:hypothetical protein